MLAGRTSAYFVDEGLAAKFDGLFEEPEKSEVDVWVENKWRISGDKVVFKYGIGG